MTIVAAFTNGDADNLMVGRNGMFSTGMVRIGTPPSSRSSIIDQRPPGVLVSLQAHRQDDREQIEKMAAAREKAVQNQTRRASRIPRRKRKRARLRRRRSMSANSLVFSPP